MTFAFYRIGLDIGLPLSVERRPGLSQTSRIAKKPKITTLDGESLE